jgi:hypothetical protein
MLVGASLLGGCAYYPVPPDPLRVVDTSVELSGCRSLGKVAGPIRTDGRAPFLYGGLTYVVPADAPDAVPPPGGYGTGPESNNLAVALQPARDEAVRRGATDLLLTRRIRRDWSYVDAIAYRCRN